jgi:2-polyprenyl-3-methyl-5-hydroxy-6-metoxy-1,4-benzoquinol methylase
MDELVDCWVGQKLYGDDFTQAEIDSWYADEAEAYAELEASTSETYKYRYHALNARYGYEHLPASSFGHVLGFGAAYGEELMPLVSRVGRITIVDPSAVFARDSIGGVDVQYVKPRSSGRLDMHDDEVDLITCFGVLHHIPNVSTVVSELARVLAPGGFMLLREPIISMGDWRTPRAGLTARERGIPLEILHSIVRSSGLRVVREFLCDFSLTNRLFRLWRDDPFNSEFVTRIDSGLCRAFTWNVNYHPRNALQLFRPRAVALVLQKNVQASDGFRAATAAAMSSPRT